jgi:hypothetical protein
MIRISDRRLWIALGALGAALFLAWTSVLSQAPASATSPAAHRAALARPVISEPAPATGVLGEPAQVTGMPSAAFVAPAATVPSSSSVVPASQLPAGQVAPPVPDRCSVVMGRGRPVPMCPPLAPQP